jgi:hypothetical protein
MDLKFQMSSFFCTRSECMAVSMILYIGSICVKSRLLDLEPQIDKKHDDHNDPTNSHTNPSIYTTIRASTKCHFCSCAIVGPNVPRMICYAPGYDQVFHSYCYDIGILRKHILLYFDTAQPKHPFSHVACKQYCYKKATRDTMKI